MVVVIDADSVMNCQCDKLYFSFLFGLTIYFLFVDDLFLEFGHHIKPDNHCNQQTESE